MCVEIMMCFQKVVSFFLLLHQRRQVKENVIALQYKLLLRKRKLILNFKLFLETSRKRVQRYIWMSFKRNLWILLSLIFLLKRALTISLLKIVVLLYRTKIEYHRCCEVDLSCHYIISYMRKEYRTILHIFWLILLQNSNCNN